MRKCSYCRSELPDEATAAATASSNPGARRATNDLVCEKCRKNEEKYGKPSMCELCQLPAAFLGGRCVHCSYSERKHGPPVACSNCKLTAAFAKDPSLRHKPLLCRLCLISYGRSVKKATAKTTPATATSKSATLSTKRRLSQEEKPVKKSLKRSESLISCDPSTTAEHVLLVQQLKDEIAELHKKLLHKDALVLERDKKIATLNADALRKDKEHRAKIMQMQKENSDCVANLQEKIRALGKQLAQSSRGRKQESNNAS